MRQNMLRESMRIVSLREPKPENLVTLFYADNIAEGSGMVGSLVELDRTTGQAYNTLEELYCVGGAQTMVPRKRVPIGYEELQKLARESRDRRAEKYLGMNADNWETYLK